MKQKRKQCITCDKKVNPGTLLCKRCLYKEEHRKMMGIKVSSDYTLQKDDYVANAFAFLDACNVLQEFIDKVDSQLSEVLMSTWSNGPCIPENIIDESTIDKYEFFYDDREHTPKKNIRYSLKTPQRK